MAIPTVAPYGSWKSPIRPDRRDFTAKEGPQPRAHFGESVAGTANQAKDFAIDFHNL